MGNVVLGLDKNVGQRKTCTITNETHYFDNNLMYIILLFVKLKNLSGSIQTSMQHLTVFVYLRFLVLSYKIYVTI